MSLWVSIFEHAALVAVGAGLCYLLLWWRGRNARKVQALEAEAFLNQARSQAEAIKRDAQLNANEQALKLREEIEQSFTARRAERAELERRLAERETLINTQLARVIESEKALRGQEKALRQRIEGVEIREARASELNRQLSERLEQVAGLNVAEAQKEFLKNVEQEALRDANILTRHILEDAKLRAQEKARHIISTAIQRYASEHTFQNTTTAIPLQSEELKGRIIGREGRNIRAFEAATGVTVLIDDTPGTVLLSGFDPVRREVARESMLRLIQDGRIHPTRIEEIVGQVRHEIDETIIRLGKEAVTKAGLPPMDLEIMKLLGRLHFRHSYSQNILEHSIEVAHLVGLIAAELGLDVTAAKRAGLLHDIGKAVDHETHGSHALVGAELIKRHGETEAVVNGVASHHNEVPPEGPLGILVSAADAISAARPGARSESLTTYLKRIEDLEKMAAGIPGVDKAFAVQAGRELRVFVLPDQIDDDHAYALARKLVSRIENELQYPGQIKVTVIREKRCVEVAK